MPTVSDSERRARRAGVRAARARRRRLLALSAMLLAVFAVAAAVAALTGGGSTRTATVAGAPATPAASSQGHRAAASAAPALPPITPAVPGIAHVYLHGPARPEVALTFDDGFCAACVARTIRVLSQTGAHATIFPNGTYAASWVPQAAAIRRLIARGQLTVGDHTFLHHDAVLESSAAFEADLANDETWIEKTFHTTARPFFRPPYGAYNSATIQVAGRLGFTKVINWSGTVADSSPRSVPYLLNAIRYWAHPGAIILMHGNYPNTSIALPRILAILKERHLRPVTLRELLG